jgi:hypothetical protein
MLMLFIDKLALTELSRKELIQAARPKFYKEHIQDKMPLQVQAASRDTNSKVLHDSMPMDGRIERSSQEGEVATSKDLL